MSSTTQNRPARAGFAFAAIHPYIDTNILLPTEKYVSHKDLMEWGTKNSYPDYLLDLYNNVPTLRAIINGNIDFITGDDVSILPLTESLPDGMMNNRGDHIRDQIKDISHDYEVYGGFALQVIRNLAGEVAEVYYIDMRYLRTNKEGNVFYYCEDWTKSVHKDVIVYPAFMPNLNWDALDDEARNRNA